MIAAAKKRHTRDIVSIWNEAFDDPCEAVMKYLEKILKYCIVFEENGRAVGMLFLLPVKCGEDRGRYVYAVATEKSARRRGISTALIDYAKKFIEENGEKFLVLVPQEEDLVNFYAKRGFSELSRMTTAEADGLCAAEEAVFVRKLTAEEYFKTRRAYLHKAELIEWDADMLEFAKDMYGGEFTELKERTGAAAYAFSVQTARGICLKELLSENPKRSAALFKRHFGAKNLTYNDFHGGKVFAMTYPRADGKRYFNIALD